MGTKAKKVKYNGDFSKVKTDEPVRVKIEENRIYTKTRIMKPDGSCLIISLCGLQADRFLPGGCYVENGPIRDECDELYEALMSIGL